MSGEDAAFWAGVVDAMGGIPASGILSLPRHDPPLLDRLHAALAYFGAKDTANSRIRIRGTAQRAAVIAALAPHAMSGSPAWVAGVTEIGLHRAPAAVQAKTLEVRAIPAFPTSPTLPVLHGNPVVVGTGRATRSPPLTDRQRDAIQRDVSWMQLTGTRLRHTEMAARACCTKAQVKFFLHRLEVPASRPSAPPLSEVLRDDIQRRFEAGVDVRRIADALGNPCSLKHIRRVGQAPWK